MLYLSDTNFLGNKIPEYLVYSNIGRLILINLKNWPSLADYGEDSM